MPGSDERGVNPHVRRQSYCTEVDNKRIAYTKKIGPYWYSDDDLLGKGAYGKVYRAVCVDEDSVTSDDTQSKVAGVVMSPTARTDGRNKEKDRDFHPKAEVGNVPTEFAVGSTSQGQPFPGTPRVVALKQMVDANQGNTISASVLREVMVLKELTNRLRSDGAPTWPARYAAGGTYLPIMRKRGMAASEVTSQKGLYCVREAPFSSSSQLSRPVTEAHSWTTQGDDDEEYTSPGISIGSSQQTDASVSHPMKEARLLAGRKHLVMLHETIFDMKQKAVYVAMEYCDGGDLWHFVRRQPQKRIEDAYLYRWYMQQFIAGMAYLHSCHISHRDLKPQNILLQRLVSPGGKDSAEKSGHCSVQGAASPPALGSTPTLEHHTDSVKLDDSYILKIADFGLSRLENIPIKKYVHEAVTLWYRSPDVLLGNTHYQFSADVWSAGAVMVEVATGCALCRGRDQKDQLKRVFHRLGGPTQVNFPSMQDYAHSKTFRSTLIHAQEAAMEEMRRGVFTAQEEEELAWLSYNDPRWVAAQRSDALDSDLFQQMQRIASLKVRLRMHLISRGCMDTVGEDGLDLIARMLLYEPGYRISMADALQHRYFASTRSETSLSIRTGDFHDEDVSQSPPLSLDHEVIAWTVAPTQQTNAVEEGEGSDNQPRREVLPTILKQAELDCAAKAETMLPVVEVNELGSLRSISTAFSPPHHQPANGSLYSTVALYRAPRKNDGKFTRPHTHTWSR